MSGFFEKFNQILMLGEKNALYYIATGVETVIKCHNRGNGKSDTISAAAQHQYRLRQ